MLAPYRKQSLSTKTLSTWSQQIRSHWKMLAAISIALCLGTIGYVANQAKSVQQSEARTPLESFNVGLKMGRHKIQLGSDTKTSYRAGRALAQGGGAQPDDEVAPPQIGALQNHAAQPLSMTNEDLNGDGMQDLVIGYAGGVGGLLTVRRGNLEAIAPQDPAVLENLRHGIYPTPFMDEVDTYDLPEAPAFLATGDFNADGYQDVIAAANFGQQLYLLTGDGHGGLRQPQAIGVPGQITAMAKGQFNRAAGFTVLAIGVTNAKGQSSAIVYDEPAKGVLGTPDRFSLPAQATAAVFAELDKDVSGDLVIGADNNVTIIHGRNPSVPGSQNRLDGFRTSAPVRAVTTGDFLFDREGMTKIAWLSDDGNVHLMTAGSLDRRPFTKEEVAQIHKARLDVDRELAPADSLPDLVKSMIHRPALGNDWQEADTRNIGGAPAGANPQSLLMSARWSGLPLDDLMVLDSAKVQMLQNTKDAAGMRTPKADTMASVDTVEIDNPPVAAAMMRLSVDGRPSLVVLGKNQIEATPIISVATLFTVNTTADTADIAPGNGTCSDGSACSLRAAIMESNAFGGSNTITLSAATTYTISLNSSFSNGPDDEFDLGGADDAGGDLDIVDWNSVCQPASSCSNLILGHPALTSVTINGGNTNTTIIQMGVMGTTHGVNKDRVLEVNDSANAGYPTDLTVTNLTIRDGSAPHWLVNNVGPGCPCFRNETGGGIKFDGTKSQAPNAGSTATLTLTNVVINNNIGSGQGGGIFLNSGSGIITGSLFTSNSSTLGSGGGLSWNGGNVPKTAALSIGSTTFGGSAPLANTGVDPAFGSGGAINTNGGTAFTLNNNSVISFNTAAATGGGLNFAGTGVISVANTTVTSNTAKKDGGGVYINARLCCAAVAPADASTSALTAATITSNTADSDNTNVGDGGGVFNTEGTLTISSTTHIDGNSAVNGGGIFTEWSGNANDPPASISMTGGTIGQSGAGNTAKKNGGGIAIDLTNHANSGGNPMTGTVTLTNLSISNNTANTSNGGFNGGGIYQNSYDSGYHVTSSLNGVTVDSNVCSSGTTGIHIATGIMSASNTLSLNGGNGLNIQGGTFTSTAGTFNLTGDFTRATAGTFTHNSGTINFNGTTTQSIQGTATSETFNNFIVNKTGLLQTGGSTTAITTNDLTMTAGSFNAPATLTVNGNALLNGGTLTGGASLDLNGNLTNNAGGTLVAGTNITSAKDWTNNGGTFTPGSNTVTFDGTLAQAINGTIANQIFNNFVVNKSSNTLSTGGSTTAVTTNNLTMTAGTFTAPATLTVNGIATLNGGTLTGGALLDLNGNLIMNNTSTLTAGASITAAKDWTRNTGNTFTQGSGTVTFDGSTAQAINGTLSTTFNNLTISNSASTVSLGINTSVAGNLSVTSSIFDLGTFTANRTAAGGQISVSDGATLKIGGTNTFPSNYSTVSLGPTSTVEYNGSAGAQTIAAVAYGNLTSSNAGTRTLANSGTIGVFTTFTPGANTYTITGSTMDFNGTGGQSIPVFNFNNLTFSNARTGANNITLPAGIVKIAGTFTATATFGTGGYVVTGNTIDYNGASAQSMPSGFPTYNNLTISNTNAAGVTGFSGLTVQGLLKVNSGSKFTSSTTLSNVQIDGTLVGTTATSMDVSGNWTNNGTFTANGNTVNFNGSSAQVIGGTQPTTFNNLTIANAGTGVSLSQDATVNGTLTLTNDLTTGAKTLIQPSTAPDSAGAGDVIGNVKRTSLTLATLTYGNPNNTIGFASGTQPTDINIKLTKTAPDPASTGQPNSGFPNAVKRTYVITPTGGSGFSATMQLHYNTLDLNGNTAGNLHLWKFITTPAPGWQQQPTPAGGTSTDNGAGVGVSLTGVTGFSPWTLANISPTAATSSITGQILDSNGNPVEGAVVNLTGDQNRKFITDSNGNYRFDNVETNGFYTVTPSRVNYSFSPAQRSFSQLGNTTNAVFSATTAGGAFLNPLDTPEYFVRQQYKDFLGREPDEAGFNFWSDQILSCSSDAGCVEGKRINVSAAFFFSIEFQQTGYLAYRTYQAAYGDIAGAPVPVRLSEFTADRQEIGNGIVVNQDGWQTALANNKQAYMSDFVQRSRFTAAYPASLTPDQFVDQLFSTAGVTPATSDRAAAVNEFGGASTSADAAARGRALQLIAENPALAQREFNQAFVLMQYFGYLRRDANSGPDTDFSGYNFWLSKLNSFGGNYQSAEMVKAFLLAGEYRGRFPK